VDLSSSKHVIFEYSCIYTKLTLVKSYIICCNYYLIKALAESWSLLMLSLFDRDISLYPLRICDYCNVYMLEVSSFIPPVSLRLSQVAHIWKCGLLLQRKFVSEKSQQAHMLRGDEFPNLSLSEQPWHVTRRYRKSKQKPSIERRSGMWKVSNHFGGFEKDLRGRVVNHARCQW
jgi:hypothetical protein